MTRTAPRGTETTARGSTVTVMQPQRTASDTELASISPQSSAALPGRSPPSGGQSLLRGCRGLAADSFVFGDDLRAEQQKNGADLDRKQRQDRRRQRAVDDAYLRHGPVVPAQQMSRQFPQ